MFITAGYISSLRTLKDRTVSFTVSTQEMPPEKATELFRLIDSYGYFCFKQEPFTKDETDTLDTLESDLYDSKKTQSQRLRAVLYLNWEKDNGGFTEFKDYYQNKTETLITHFKDKLD